MWIYLKSKKDKKIIEALFRRHKLVVLNSSIISELIDSEVFLVYFEVIKDKSTHIHTLLLSDFFDGEYRLKEAFTSYTVSDVKIYL